MTTTTYAQVSSKLGDVKGVTKSIAREVFDAATGAGHDVWFLWGDGPGDEHGSGLALDFMVRDKDTGDFVRNYLWQHRGRLRLRHVIWHQRITSTVKSPGVVRLMADRGDVTKNHEDHVHVWFFDGTYQAPTRPTTAPRPAVPPYPGKQLRRGAKGAAVKQLQARLKARGWSIKVDGSFGPATEKVVRQFQANKGLRVDGIVGRATHSALWLLPVS
ncbi:peptidoglycan-binding domain-containing protein [Knoellia sp. CPCC 206450]|uniref:peptidoglycan-binding domain-containing protein n=1 Tax=Knoellia tibetensis TaxID=3404798 RepID=UPI003B430F26